MRPQRPAVDAPAGAPVHAEFHGGVYRSDDAGASWVDVGDGTDLPSDFGFPIVVDPADPDSAYVIPLIGAEDRTTPEGAVRVWETLAQTAETPCEALAKACEETLSALDHDDRAAIDIRLAVRKHGDAGASADGQNWDPWEVADAIGEELLPTLRWLLTQASGTIGRVAHQLEHRAAEIDDSAREQLRDDVMVVDDELATVEALLLPLTDWDSELERLLNGELPPFAADEDPQDDD